MKNERWILIRADRYYIYMPEFFNAYDEAHKEMKCQYESFSNGCIGELNDDDAWYMSDGHVTNWKIFCVE